MLLMINVMMINIYWMFLFTGSLLSNLQTVYSLKLLNNSLNVENFIHIDPSNIHLVLYMLHLSYVLILYQKQHQIFFNLSFVFYKNINFTFIYFIYLFAYVFINSTLLFLYYQLKFWYNFPSAWRISFSISSGIVHCHQIILALFIFNMKIY